MIKKLLLLTFSFVCLASLHLTKPPVVWAGCATGTSFWCAPYNNICTPAGCDPDEPGCTCSWQCGTYTQQSCSFAAGSCFGRCLGLECTGTNNCAVAPTSVPGQPTPTTGGPTNTPVPATTPTPAGASCSSIGGACRASNPYDPYNIWNGDHGQCHSVYLPYHYRYIAPYSSYDANCAQINSCDPGEFMCNDTCCGPLWPNPTATPTPVPPTPTPPCTRPPAVGLSGPSGQSCIAVTTSTNAYTITDAGGESYCYPHDSMVAIKPDNGAGQPVAGSSNLASDVWINDVFNQSGDTHPENYTLNLGRYVWRGWSRDTDNNSSLATNWVPFQILGKPPAPANLSVSVSNSLSATNRCGGRTVTCTNDTTPTWSWTTPSGLYCPITRTRLYQNPPSQWVDYNTSGISTSYTPASGDTWFSSNNGPLVNGECRTVNALYINAGDWGAYNTTDNVWVQADTQATMPASDALSCSYYLDPVTGNDYFKVVHTWNSVADVGCAGLKDYVSQISDYANYSGKFELTTTTTTHNLDSSLWTAGTTIYARVKSEDNLINASNWQSTSRVVNCNNCAGCPAPGVTVTPIPATVTPIPATVTPIPATVTPVTATVTPAPRCDAVAPARPIIPNPVELARNILISWNWDADYSCSNCSSEVQCTNTYNCEGPVNYCVGGAPSGSYWTGCGAGCATAYVYTYKIFDDGNLMADGYASLGSSYSVSCVGKEGHEITSEVRAIDARGNQSLVATSSATCSDPNATPTPTPSCSYGPWADDACNAGGCAATQMHRTRSITSGDASYCGGVLTLCVARQECSSPTVGPTVGPTATPIPPTPTPGPCAAACRVTNVTATDGTFSDQVSFSWTISGGGTGYHLHTGHPGWWPSEPPATSGSRSETGLLCGYSNTYTVDCYRTIDHVYCSGRSDVGSTRVCSFCGDGLVQTPNDAGTGGPLNDGNEECDGGTNCDMTGYGCILISDSWWQTYGGLVYANNVITSFIPNTASSSLFLILKNLTSLLDSAGIPLTSYNSILTGDGSYTDRDDQAVVQSANYAQVVRQDYDYFARFYYLNDPGLDDMGDSETTTTIYDFDAQPYLLVDDTLIFKSSGDLNIDLSGTLSPGGPGSKQIVFVAGDIHFLNSSHLTSITSLSQGEFLAFIANGTITFADTIGYADPTTNPTSVAPNVSGLFVADKIVIDSNSGTDRKFIGEGTFVGWDSFELGRDYDSATNNYDPTEVFIYRPDLVLSAPERIKQPINVWQEIL
ncbi:hypothetical protein KKF92_01040 [Patescibacteria group bacterium]|nr:hypothetical protein [Patescibacteria group bacterium]